MAVEKIQIKDIDDNVLFEYECEGNTLKRTVEVAVSQNADLDNANLYNANLYNANLYNANLENANLENANLYNANLDNADLYNADLYNANLENANLENANLYNANLENANLENADLYNANLENANLENAKEIPYVPIWCPSDGPFVGWKKVGSCLVKLLIPDDAERCSATTRKSRCSKALVVSILDLHTNEDVQEITNKAYTPEVTYKVGEMVLPDSFDKDRWNECSHGIHFFINKQDAIDYNG